MASSSPFKFLDSYAEQDIDIWFGREQETNKLYEALSGVKHLLIYGPSGAGKTSLIECGLRNRFSDADWMPISIRRGADLIGSTYEALNNALLELDEDGTVLADNRIDLDPVTKRPLDPDITFGDLVEQIYEENYQPVYLLFDQFEELLISGKQHEKDALDERKQFFQRLNKLIKYRVPCRAILIMREEFVGNLSEFEHICPSIFQHRFRLEKMRRKNVQSMILNTLTAEQFQSDFQVEDAHQLTEAILEKIPDRRQEIELAHVQVFFDELWERANTENPDAPTLRTSLIQEKDNLESILDNFLQNQRKELEPRYGKESLLEVLTQMISERDTKLQVSQADIEQGLKKEGVVLKGSLHEILLQGKERRMIRTLKVGKNTHYEISHDLLAQVIGQNRTNKMKLRERATDVYEVYLGRVGLFSQEDLNYILPFDTFKPIPATLQARIEESQTAIEEARKAESQVRIQRLGSLAGVAIIGLVVSLYFGFNARSTAQKNIALAESLQEKTDNLEEALNGQEKALADFMQADSLRRIQKFAELEGQASRILNEDNREGCPRAIFAQMLELANEKNVADRANLIDRIEAIRQLNPSCE